MASPQAQFAFSLPQALAAGRRWAGRAPQHEAFEEAARTKSYSRLDTPERCAARAENLLRKMEATAPAAAEAMRAEIPDAAAGHLEGTETSAVSDVLLERIIGKTRDFQFVEFLEKAICASRSVGRVVTQLGGGRISYGTGFMVTSRLLITNQHVLSTEDSAAKSVVEFDYQRDRLGQQLIVRRFKLDPTTFFLNDERLDFALVAVSEEGATRPLRDYWWCPLLKDAGKIVAPEPINIIQHPKGEMKQIVVRENRLIDSLDGADLFYHYEADTEPGSSGSPVFNDQWEVVAIHHSAIPKMNAKKEPLDVDGNVWRKTDDPARLAWVGNEGVRISQIVKHVAATPVKAEARELVREFLAAKPPPVSSLVFPPSGPASPESTPAGKDVADSRTEAGAVTFTVPLHVIVRLGTAGSGVEGMLRVAAGATPPSNHEKVEIDPDYSNREGFDRNFLAFPVPFPRLTAFSRPKAYALGQGSGDARFELKYHHYSLIFNKERKLAFVAGVNFDPTAEYRHKREPDKWFYDSRIQPEKELQAGEALYAGNPLDRGHLVRRADAGWGHTPEEAKLANDDTFHFSNCSPQHAITNQGQTGAAPAGMALWGSLEEHIAAQGKAGKRKLSIFNGPIFRSNDRKYRGVQLPKEFWKLVVFANDTGAPAAAAFLLTQAELIQDLKEEFEVGEYKTVQIGISDLATRTNLNFGDIAGWDVLDRDGAEESFVSDTPRVALSSLEDMVL